MNNEICIKKEYTCAITGHRRAYDNIKKEDIRDVFISLIESGYDTFLVGMAVGFDTFCFKILNKLKEDYNFRIIACVPCENQDKNFSIKQKREYRELLQLADEKVLIEKEYTPYCMLKRNRFMVDNSSVLVSYLREDKGGTKYTVNYAKSKGIKIINV